MRNKKVFVAMSGGVDSSVAAALLKRGYLDSHGRIGIVPTSVEDPRSSIGTEGRRPKARYSRAIFIRMGAFAGRYSRADFEVVGVYMKPWQSQPSAFSYQLSADCLWEQEREDAARVAAKLNIPFLTWDFSKEYEKEVVKYMIEGYKSGITPNPDVMCNKYIKFGLFLKKALKHGADYIATGHYVRLRRYNPNLRMESEYSEYSRHSDKNSKHSDYVLFRAKDKNKDQSYFLWTLTQEQLKHCLFPIGDYTKPEVRKLANKFGLPNWDKKDSQGICFIGPLNIKDFLKGCIKQKRGKIVLTTKNSHHFDISKYQSVIGEHDGVFYYTIGERLAVDTRPYFVIDKDIKKNILYVAGGREENPRKEIEVHNLNLISNSLTFPLNCSVKTRYQQKGVEAILNKNKIKLTEPLFDITPGQSAVFYKGQRVIGGGIIK